MEHGAFWLRNQVFTVEPMINLGGNGGDRTGSPKPRHTIAEDEKVYEIWMYLAYALCKHI